MECIQTLHERQCSDLQIKERGRIHDSEAGGCKGCTRIVSRYGDNVDPLAQTMKNIWKFSSFFLLHWRNPLYKSSPSALNVIYSRTYATPNQTLGISQYTILLFTIQTLCSPSPNVWNNFFLFLGCFPHDISLRNHER